MIGILIRVVLFLAIGAGIYFVLKMLLTPSDYIRCSRCDGKGFWLGARGRETCDWCKGSGKLPRQDR